MSVVDERSIPDRGRQPERTELSWRRTALATGVGALLSFRVLPTGFADPWWMVIGTLFMLAAVGLWIAARARYRAISQALRISGHRARLPGGMLVACVAVGVFAVGVLCAAIVVSYAR